MDSFGYVSGLFIYHAETDSSVTLELRCELTTIHFDYQDMCIARSSGYMYDFQKKTQVVTSKQGSYWGEPCYIHLDRVLYRNIPTQTNLSLTYSRDIGGLLASSILTSRLVRAYAERNRASRCSFQPVCRISSTISTHEAKI
jgi:hypothetical protein